ncbi:Ras-related protein Rab-23 [Temnothorax longispinosus]|uniref:non-specific protein-tyrosine kinase n=1 Tax=Temnothorax longispinosus TaxID=300112 RepID=A0A4V3SBZ4_9HYME|nr:Ras-related protein Rab-23 [Temnothorax longispinosus]
MSRRWYFRKIKRIEAEKKLLLPENDHGAFLIRDSESRHNDYSLSVRDGDTVKHYRIRQLDEGGFFIARRTTFRNLQDLVEHYSKDADGLCVNLCKPCVQVVIVGNGAVGKSSMIQRFCKGTYTRDYKKTIGVDFLEREIEVDGEDVRLMLWDTAGQEEFDAITAAYYRGAHACVLAYSATDRDSFDAIPSWKLKVQIFLVQNKIDLVDQSVIDPDEAERLSRALGCKLLRTSVKEDIGVMSVFRHLASRCLHEMRRSDDDYQDDLRLYSAEPRSPSVISAFSPDGSMCGRNAGNGTIILRPGGKTKSHKKRNFVKNACRLL